MATLANDDAERSISRSYVTYAPLYPTFQESLNRFRQGERLELLHRGAERIVHNVDLYDTRRNSEDCGVDISVILEELVTSGPSEAHLVDEGEQSAPSNDNVETQLETGEEHLPPNGDSAAYYIRCARRITMICMRQRLSPRYCRMSWYS